MPLRCWLGHALRNTMDDLAHALGADTQDRSVDANASFTRRRPAFDSSSNNVLDVQVLPTADILPRPAQHHGRPRAR